MALQIYNTMSGRKEEFVPLNPGKVGIYCCGPTVYMQSHIGHMVGPVIFDTVKRYLAYSGFQVTLVINITDVEDKLIKQAAAEQTSVDRLARSVTEDYLENIAKLGVEGIDHMPRATQHIGEIIAITQGLVDRGFAYEVSGDVYFDVAKDEDYGKLSHRDPEALQAGARVDPNPLKRNLGDFALWKAAKPGEPSWQSPWGPGRPGWHIECSAMSMKLLGETFDIHGGGLDLVFPHHENEVAQSECFSGKTFARYWMHNGLLRRTGQAAKLGGRSHESTPEPETKAEQEQKKMAKSAGNIVTIRELLTRHAGETVRFFLLSTHYRRPVEFSDERIEEVGKGLQAFYRFFERFERISGERFYDLAAATTRPQGPLEQPSDPFRAAVAEHRGNFLAQMDDDFNTAGAVGNLFDLLKTLNGFIDRHGLDGPADRQQEQVTRLRDGARVLKELSGILGVFQHPVDRGPAGSKDELTGKLLSLLVELRASARSSKNFALADEIRNRLAQIGVSLEDRPDGTGWRIQ